MAKDKRRMMRNRAKKMARDAARRRQRRREQARTSGGRFADMGCTRAELERSPIHAAYAGSKILTQGIGYAIIGRELPDGRVAAGLFLVDAYCLGVKDAFLTVQTPSEFQDTVKTRLGAAGLDPVSPAYARKLIEGAIAYARDLGFEQHPDYRVAAVVLGDIDPAQCPEVLTFGHEGKPLYISGPYDSEARIRAIVAQLRRRCGEDGAHYIVRASDPSVADSLGPNERLIRIDENEIE